MRAIVPGPIRLSRFEHMFAEATAKTIDEAEQLFAKTYGTFDNKPSFQRERRRGSVIADATYTEDENYARLVKGTRPHHIPTTPKPGKFLVFPTGFEPKTRPGVLQSTAGSKGDPNDLVFVPQEVGVDHPGTKPRPWPEKIALKLTPKFIRRGEAAMSKAAKASGHVA